MRSSRNCPLKLQALIATQSQLLLDIEVVASPQLALIVSPVLTAPIASMASIASPVLIAPITSTAPRQLSPDRPEVLMQAYLAEKEAWLAQHPTV